MQPVMTVREILKLEHPPAKVLELLNVRIKGLGFERSTVEGKGHGYDRTSSGDRSQAHQVDEFASREGL